MKLKQLSVFLENKPGALGAPCRLLAKADINIQTFSLADTREFGILRLIVEDSDKARRLLQRNGFAVKLTEVVVLEVPDRPGGEYAYAFTNRTKGGGLLVFRFSDPDAALRVLKARKITAIDSVELNKRLKD
jgi:hypothetical protein